MDSIPGWLDRDREATKTPNGVETPGEKVGKKEQEQWQTHHTHHTALSQGGCVHALTSSTKDPGPCQAPELPTLPTPTQLGSLPLGLPSIKATAAGS